MTRIVAGCRKLAAPLADSLALCLSGGSTENQGIAHDHFVTHIDPTIEPAP